MSRRKYLIDTSLYIDAIRDARKAEELEEFSSAFAPLLYMSSVVAKELIVGADPNKRARRRVERALIAPFERVGRVVTPGHRAWKRAGEIVARLSRNMDPIYGEPVRSSFWNDALIAASCAESGLTLVSRNAKDCRRVLSVLPFKFAEPWPG